MEDIFGAFDDDAFGETKTKTAPKLISYNAKICAPEWFLDATVASDQNIGSKDVGDQVVIRQYRGNRLYLSGNYSDALDEFRKAEELISPNNGTVLRNVLEAKVRCSLQLGQRDTREDMCKLRCLISSPANRVSFLHLELQLFKSGENSRGVVLTLQRLLSLLPLSADLWVQLAQALEEGDEEIKDEEPRNVEQHGDRNFEDEKVISSASCSCLSTNSVPDCPNAISPAQDKETKCLWRLDRDEFRLPCLIWAKLCLLSDYPSTSLLDGEDLSANFALEKSAAMLKDVETRMSMFRDLDNVESLTQMIGKKFVKLSTFDDHGSDFYGCQFLRFFCHDSDSVASSKKSSIRLTATENLP